MIDGMRESFFVAALSVGGVGVYLNAAEFFAFYEDWCLRRIYDIFYVFFGVGYTD